MFPAGRVFLGFGRDELLNEVPAGTSWPPNEARFERLKEAITLIKRLWMEDWVTFHGKYYQVKNSSLYTKPLSRFQYTLQALGVNLQD
jgi:coenzyme F420-dependent glucose-6-phosphate dehydrogenase